MISRAKIKNALLALAGTVLFGSIASPGPAEARNWHGWGGYTRPVVVHSWKRCSRGVVRRRQPASAVAVTERTCVRDRAGNQTCRRVIL